MPRKWMPPMPLQPNSQRKGYARAIQHPSREPCGPPEAWSAGCCTGDPKARCGRGTARSTPSRPLWEGPQDANAARASMNAEPRRSRRAREHVCFSMAANIACAPRQRPYGRFHGPVYG
eukprot:5066944-Pyramimonas_sp.AAC.1